MTNAAWFHCFSGVAGDMALGALIDAGASAEELEADLRRLDLPGWQLRAVDVLRAGVRATRLVVAVDDEVTERHLSDIEDMITSAGYSTRVTTRALQTFRRLGEVEAKMHGVPISQVHFHEVGAVDSIIDIVGTCLALEQLDVGEIHCSEIAVGAGTVRAAHGVLPNPAPATTALLVDVPVQGRNVDRELTTPTGAALMRTLTTRFGSLPNMTVRTQGFGAGTADIEGWPNVVQVILGVLSEESSDAQQPVVLLETNVDDVTGEVLGRTISELMNAGAMDAWITPIVMKKGRPAHTVSALVDVGNSARAADVILRETGTFGLRRHIVDKLARTRELAEINVNGHTLRVKRSQARTKVEFDDAVAVANATGRSAREIIAEVERADS